jgi:hypothetical protein
LISIRGNYKKKVKIATINEQKRRLSNRLPLHGLVLRNEGLHDYPGEEVGDAAVAEDDEIAGGLAAESHECEGVGLLLVTFLVVQYVNFGIYLPISATMAILALPLMALIFVKGSGKRYNSIGLYFGTRLFMMLQAMR